MRFSYKDVFDLRDHANQMLADAGNDDRLLAKPKFEFVDIYSQNIHTKKETLLVTNITRDEAYRWFEGFNVSMLDKFDIAMGVKQQGTNYWRELVDKFKFIFGKIENN